MTRIAGDSLGLHTASLFCTQSLPLHVVGCSHETATEATIGKLGVGETELTALLRQVFARGIPCVLLSTCNRTELYWWGTADAAPVFRAWVAGRVAVDATATIERRDGEDAVRHLMSVGAGLRSRRIGEPEILGQTRRAFAIARGAGVTCAALDEVFQHAINAARYIRSRVGEHRWGRTLGEASVEFIAEMTARELSSQRAVVVGSGAAAESAVLALQQRVPASLQVLSRTDERAMALALATGAASARWSDRFVWLAEADVVIWATRSQAPVVDASDIASISAARGAHDARAALWLDLGVPPNVARDVAHANVRVFALHDLPGETDARSLAIATALDALDAEVDRFMSERRRRVSSFSRREPEAARVSAVMHAAH